MIIWSPLNSVLLFLLVMLCFVPQKCNNESAEQLRIEEEVELLVVGLPSAQHHLNVTPAIHSRQQRTREASRVVECGKYHKTSW